MAEAGPSHPHPPPKPDAPKPDAKGKPTFARRLAGSKGARLAATAWRWKAPVFGVLAVGYVGLVYSAEKQKARKRDTIPDKTYLYWKLYDGGIVEAKSTGSSLNYLLSSSQSGAPEEPPRVMTIFDVVRTLKFIENDDRVRGIIADFSHTSLPSVPSYNLGLAQLEEIQDAMLELRRVKHDKFGPEGWRTVAWTDTFTSQGQYLLASTFDEVYCQPTGEVPLVGLGSTTPFFGRLARWLGIEVHAEARNEYKSFISPYTREEFTEPQRENHAQLINDLNDNLLTYIGRNRFPEKGGQGSLDHVRALTKVGPFTARTAVESGLVNGTTYRQDVLHSVTDEGFGGDPEVKFMGFYHYHKVLERAVEKHMKEAVEVGVVYVLGGIGDAGEFGTASIVRGLKEAGEDETIGAVVLRIDSGGGAVVDSDTIWGAVRELRVKYGKTVVASFGNASASGGYWISTHADAILAAPSTITGSIGVASLRPTFLQSFFDRFHVTLESFFTGSRAQDPTHSLTPAELERHSRSVDDMYDDFKRRVCEGREISPDVIEGIAGGRVLSGLKAFELNAPEELIRQIKGLDVPPLDVEQLRTVGDASVAPVEVGGAESTPVAVLPEDQETSPFAVPEVELQAIVAPVADAAGADTSASASAASPSPGPSPTTSTSSSSTVANVAAAALDSSDTTSSITSRRTSTDASTEAAGAPAAGPAARRQVGGVNGAAGTYEYEPGPYGRGLIDGLGGLRDSAIYACQLFIANGIAGYKEQNPGATDQDAMRELLPDVKFVQADNGELALALDVTLKRFPVQKSFWQQLADASRRGDSLGDSVSSVLVPQLHALRTVAARWFLSAVADSVVEELNGSATPGAGSGVGLAGARGAGLAGKLAGATGVKEGRRAEWNGGARWM
ncbi:uncharacterized protein RHOBADRAFT_55673 [Rhodotorula graminis WP1]|uniref:Peptidase S49 domain-containing protein n=1 Tax=Rhodotorula graminis (strain WP1) TaxID=578459 RepID=A0A0P9EZC6_RHOGW|nr:uncharacterized protein RHOBADRAFT_55673 [Rhodotorula graminis WP1]KPV72572.1 hypothetical protein RHOBADRAFT_55673 [Rhodotorula graminis WP1]